VGDLLAASDIIDDMFEDRDVHSAYFQFIEALARTFVEEHWHEIKAVAAELVKAGIMLRDANTCPAWCRAA
jgi:hypothetical protein